MDRFWKKPLRIIQNNLRATDAEKMDVEQLIRTQAEYGTNVIVANAGGIMCWYESSISRQPHNPYLKTDYVSQVMHYAHQYGMKVLLRLDVSNLSEKDVHEHPDWLRRDAEGKAVTDLGMPQSCFFSPMWQEYNFQLIDELMTRYKPDGLFYNANHFGFCHCEVCKERYRKTTGHELPDRLLVNTEEGREYMRYRYREMAAYFTRVREAVHRHNPDAVLAPVGSFCTERPMFNSLSGWDGRLFTEAEDIQVSETVTHLFRAQPYWTYLPGENAAATNTISKPAMLCIHQACQFGRNAVTPPAKYVYDIMQAACHGGGPTINMIGTFDQEDKKGLEPLRKTYRFLCDNEDCFDGLRLKNRVALVYSQKSNDYDSRDDQTAFSPGDLHGMVTPTICGDEYRGIYEALTHMHIPFDVLHDGFLRDAPLDRYEVMILPGVTCLDEEQAKAVDGFVKRGGRLLVTGALPTKDGEGRECGTRLKCLPFTVEEKKPVDGYVLLQKRELYPSLPDTGLVGIIYDWSVIRPKERLEKQTVDMRRRKGPKNNKPEFCNIAEMTDEYGLYLVENRFAVLPWAIGRLYRNYGIYECPLVLKDLLTAMNLTQDIQTNAPYTVQIIWADAAAGETLALLNTTGFSGKQMLAVIPLEGFRVSVRTKASVAYSRVTHTYYQTRRAETFLEIDIPSLNAYDLIVLEEKKAE